MEEIKLRPHETIVKMSGTKYCCVCQKHFLEEECVRIKTATMYPQFRHVGCFPKGRDKRVIGKEEQEARFIKRNQDAPRMSQGEKRQRAKGSGYTGGTGYKNL